MEVFLKLLKRNNIINETTSKNIQNGKKSKSDKKPQKGIRTSIKNTFSELKKVEWCSIKNAFKYTFISIIIATIMALALYSLNCASAEIVDLVKGAL